MSEKVNIKINNVQNLPNLNLFEKTFSIKEWNLKNLDWFILEDSLYFNEYGKIETKTLVDEFIKKNKKKGKTLFDYLKKWDLSLNFTWHITCASFLWYTLDKISFISIWYRKRLTAFIIKTDDGQEITLTKNQELLTNTWYKAVSKLEKGDSLVWCKWMSYTFKNGWLKKWFLNTVKELENIKKVIVKNKSTKIKTKELDKNTFSLLNILWVDIKNNEIYLEDIQNMINIQKKKKSDISDIEIENTFWWRKKKNIFIRNIESIEKVEKKDTLVWSVVTKNSENYIINNFIIKK